MESKWWKRKGPFGKLGYLNNTHGKCKTHALKNRAHEMNLQHWDLVWGNKEGAHSTASSAESQYTGPTPHPKQQHGVGGSHGMCSHKQPQLSSTRNTELADKHPWKITLPSMQMWELVRNSRKSLSLVKNTHYTMIFISENCNTPAIPPTAYYWLYFTFGQAETKKHKWNNGSDTYGQQNLTLGYFSSL